jgi:hypothetical protein
MNTNLIGRTVMYELLDESWLVGEVLQASQTTLTIHFKSFVENAIQKPLRRDYKQDVKIKDITLPKYA